MIEFWIHFERFGHVLLNRYWLRKRSKDWYEVFYREGETWWLALTSQNKEFAFERFYNWGFNNMACTWALGAFSETANPEQNKVLPELDLFALKIIERDPICTDMARDALKI
jgi:hypothetical protein